MKKKRKILNLTRGADDYLAESFSFNLLSIPANMDIKAMYKQWIDEDSELTFDRWLLENGATEPTEDEVIDFDY